MLKIVLGIVLSAEFRTTKCTVETYIIAIRREVIERNVIFLNLLSFSYETSKMSHNERMK